MDANVDGYSEEETAEMNAEVNEEIWKASEGAMVELNAISFLESRALAPNDLIRADTVATFLVEFSKQCKQFDGQAVQEKEPYSRERSCGSESL